jgi:hypothetical protein
MTDTATRVIVPVAEVAVEAYRIVFGRFGLLLDLAWLPLLILLAAALLPGYLHLYLGWAVIPSWRGDALGFTVENLIESLVGLLCLNAFAVRWHQAVLFSGERGPPAGLFIGAWVRFLLYTLLLYLVSTGVLVALLVADVESAPAYLAPVASTLAMLLWVGMLRCSLLFPAAAFGKPLGIVAAWRSMRGNSWRLLGCGFVACAPLVVVMVLIVAGVVAGFQIERFAPSPPLGFFILRGVVATCANFIIVALGATVLSIFYRRIMLRGLGVF